VVSSQPPTISLSQPLDTSSNTTSPYHLEGHHSSTNVQEIIRAIYQTLTSSRAYGFYGEVIARQVNIPVSTSKKQPLSNSLRYPGVSHVVPDFQAQKELSTMRNSEGIEVFVKSVKRDEAYEEYAIPDAGDQTDPDKVERYIEAVTGEQFAVVVRIPADFKYYAAEGVRIKVDRGKSDRYRFRKKPLARDRNGIEYVRDTLPCHIDGQ